MRIKQADIMSVCFAVRQNILQKGDEHLLNKAHHLSFRPCLLKSSILRMNLNNGGPSRTAISINSSKNSPHPIAMTGRQASTLNKSANKPLNKFLSMDYFNIGILIP